MLIEKARAFESASYKGLFHFVRYMEQLKKYNVDYGEASIEDEQSDTVRIMTIHKSKGLEFLSSLWREWENGSICRMPGAAWPASSYGNRTGCGTPGGADQDAQPGKK